MSRQGKKHLYSFIEGNYFGKSLTYTVKGDGQTDTAPTEIEVSFSADPNYKKINMEDPLTLEYTANPTILVSATAKVMDGTKTKDVKKLIGTLELDIPENLNNSLSETYNWLYNPPEILDSALTCFSDVAVTSGATLEVEGDIRVKGTQNGKTSTITNPLGEVRLVVPPITSMGGLIVSNGGKLEIRTLTAGSSSINRPAESYLSNGSKVIMSNHPKLLSSAVGQPITTSNYSTNSGSIYCVGNVFVTQGWSESTVDTSRYLETNKSTLQVGGDIIANTLAICDDSTGGVNENGHVQDNQAKGNSIQVGKNVFVENDVRITKYVSKSNIDVGGAIFGISDGDLNKYDISILSGGTLLNKEARDPNASSGVFNEGGEDTLISAEGIYVNGRPYIDFGGGTYFALWEGIGEPFKEARSYYDLPSYKIDGNDKYIVDGSVLATEIKKDKVWIRNESNFYVPDNVFASAKFGDPQPLEGKTKKASATEPFSNQSMALATFYKGANWDGSATVKPIEKLTSKYDSYNEDAYFKQGINYYAGNLSSYTTEKDMYFRQFKNVETTNYLGLRGYMLSKKSIFYGANSGSEDKEALLLDFDKVVNLDYLDSTTPWSYENPIEYVNGDEIDISKYYVDEGAGMVPYPTILVNKGQRELTLKATEVDALGNPLNTFKGIIISKGNVRIEDSLTIEGTLIIGGDQQGNTQERMVGKDVGLRVAGTGNTVKLIHNPDILLQVKASDRKAYQNILDALKITRFNEVNEADAPASFKDETVQISSILGEYYKVLESDTTVLKDPIIYTTGRVKLSNQSILELETSKIKIHLKNMKKLSG